MAATIRRRVAGAVCAAALAAGTAVSGLAGPAPAASSSSRSLRVLWAPASGSVISGVDPVVVRFSQPLAARSPLPRFSPKVPGVWRLVNPTRAVFYVHAGLPAGRVITLVAPAGSGGVRSASGADLATRLVRPLRVQSPTLLRVQQLLANLGYLPLRFVTRTPQPRTSVADQLRDAFLPPKGTFEWRWAPPGSLHSQWVRGRVTPVTTGALYAFESRHHLGLAPRITRSLWVDLLGAELANRAAVNPNGYTYAVASKALPETLTVWHTGRVLLRTLANTGIPARPTANGTFPVFEKLPFQIMRGTNPNGSHYADPVYWVNYFNGSDAVHQFTRASYGYPQSLGCVEIPMGPAREIYPYMVIGTLVTVAG